MLPSMNYGVDEVPSIYNKPHQQSGPLRLLSLPFAKKMGREIGGVCTFLLHSLKDVFAEDINKGGECWV